MGYGGPVGAAQRGPTAVPGQSAPTISPTGTYVGPGAPGSEAYLNGGVGSALTTYDQAPLPGRTSDKELQTRQAQSRVDEANSRRNQVYANPNATQADKDSADLAYLQAQNSLESSQKSGQKTSSADLSLQGFGAKAGTIAANAVLGFFGLENSVLSSSNPYNRAANSVIDFYGNPARARRLWRVWVYAAEPSAIVVSGRRAGWRVERCRARWCDRCRCHPERCHPRTTPPAQQPPPSRA